MAAFQPERCFAGLPDWSAIVVAGPDAVKFLQGFCTNDVARLAEGDACEAFFTDVKARVLAYGWVARRGDRCVVLLSSSGAAKLAEHLDRYVLRDDVALSVPEWAFLLASGACEGEVCVPVAAFGESACVVMGEGLPDLAAEGWRELSAGEFETARIRLGVPKDGVDVDARNLPQEVDRNDRAISFTKGCYLGQEPVARIDALGQVNWLLRGLRFASGEGLTRDGELLADGKPVGRVTSFVEAEGGAVGLGYVRRAHAESGAKLELGGAAVEVTALPMSHESPPPQGEGESTRA